MTINNVKFNSPDIDGIIVGNIFFSNRYGISLLTSQGTSVYDLTFYIQTKNIWRSAMDTNLFTVSPENNLVNLTEEQVNNYISQVENLPNKEG